MSEEPLRISYNGMRVKRVIVTFKDTETITYSELYRARDKTIDTIMVITKDKLSMLETIIMRGNDIVKMEGIPFSSLRMIEVQFFSECEIKKIKE
jgi:hypothetical protein